MINNRLANRALLLSRLCLWAVGIPAERFDGNQHTTCTRSRSTGLQHCTQIRRAPPNRKFRLVRRSDQDHSPPTRSPSISLSLIILTAVLGKKGVLILNRCCNALPSCIRILRSMTSICGQADSQKRLTVQVSYFGPFSRISLAASGRAIDSGTPISTTSRSNLGFFGLLMLFLNDLIT